MHKDEIAFSTIKKVTLHCNYSLIQFISLVVQSLLDLSVYMKLSCRLLRRLLIRLSRFLRDLETRKYSNFIIS